MTPIHVGLVADPALPTDIAGRMSDLRPPRGEDPHGWNIEVVSEPFTTGCEDVETALARLGDHAREHGWDVVVGLTELPLRDEDDRRYRDHCLDTMPQHALCSGGGRGHAPTAREGLDDMQTRAGGSVESDGGR